MVTKTQKKTNSQFCCKKCDYNASNKNNLDNHNLTCKQCKVTVSDKKNEKKYSCQLCDFLSYKKTDFTRHLSTRKHKLMVSGDKKNEKNEKNICNLCNKEYKSRNGVWRHKQKCNNTNTEILKEEKGKVETLTELVLTQQDMLTNQSNLINNQQEQIKEFHETLKTVMNSHEKREEVFLELAKKPSIMGNNNNNINSNNINYHVYLNEHCANAIDFPDFLNNLSISMEDLFYSKDNGYPKAISNIFQKNLSILDKTERPIHCSDKKRMNFYIKDGKWEKDKDNKKILESIWKVTHKQIKYMDEWRKANPNWRDNEEKDLEFLNIVTNIMGGSTDEEQLKNKKKIIKELANNNDIKLLFS
uniref:C2H2-type domain-containing protein n=1 Tax=viral metagenome TaxID=1070528 RepID=A0A6C0KG23_9ZZZZ